VSGGEQSLPELVLVGGGHAHVQVLRALAMARRPARRLTLVVDRPVAVYSGMVPGFVAGQYRADELEIDVVPLARRAGARVILAPVHGIDPDARRIHIEGRPPVAYDVASLDVGSTVSGIEVAGVREYAIATRPIGRFVQQIVALVARSIGADTARVLVAGGGAAGVELAFTIDRRLRDAGVEPSVTLVHAGEQLLPDLPAGLAARVVERARARGIDVRPGARVVGVRAGSVRLDAGDELATDAVLWATGAAPHPWLRATKLPTDERGFIRSRSTLQVEGYDDLFAVGDCASLTAHPWTPKAGVYAVRQGPLLTHNLVAALQGRTLRRYRPQADYLALLNMGDGSAIGSKWGRVFEGPWVMRLKDRIDRRFMRRFQVLDAAGAPTAEFTAPEMAAMEPMLCGGCAAKVSEDVLRRVLDRVGCRADGSVVLGLDRPDDVAAVRSPGGGLVVASIDGFGPFTDDPWLVGRVGAINAASDLHAKGVAPRHALAFVALPSALTDDRAEDLLTEVLAGARAAFDPLAVTIVGGHTTTAPELLVGFTITGFAGDGELFTLDRAVPDQRLILTKALGTGVLFRADMEGRAAGRWVLAAIDSVCRANAGAMEVARSVSATAATDVTGFGLAGHLGGLLRASGASARVDLAELPALDGAVELLRQGVRSTAHAHNERARRGLAVAANAAKHPGLPLLFDPQTAGGLLIAVPAERAAEAIERLHSAGDRHAAEIGIVLPPRADGAAIEVVVG